MTDDPYRLKSESSKRHMNSLSTVDSDSNDWKAIALEPAFSVRFALTSICDVGLHEFFIAMGQSY